MDQHRQEQAAAQIMAEAEASMVARRDEQVGS